MSGIEILIGDHQGVYIPQQFASWSNWNNISEEEKEDLSRGPDYDYYWDVWQLVLDNATHTDKDGNVWRLYQDGDLWAYCEELMTEEEKENLFGH
jgi:hypothetical protein